MSKLLCGKNMSYAYEPGVPALNKVDIDIVAGSIMGIVGPNGSGKSTLLRLLAGQLPLQIGEVNLQNKPLHSVPAKVRGRCIAYLPQMVQPVFSLQVREVVALGRYPYEGLMGAVLSGKGEDKTVTRCLEITHCTALAQRTFDTLSGGERQRVLLASILAQEPEVLLLDEPTAALDLHHQEEVFALLKKLSREAGYGIGIITHDLNLAARYCDQLLLLDQEHGVAAVGTPGGALQADVLSAAYGATIQVAVHPLTGTPLVHAVVQGEHSP